MFRLIKRDYTVHSPRCADCYSVDEDFIDIDLEIANANSRSKNILLCIFVCED